MIVFVKSTNETFWFPIFRLNDLKSSDFPLFGTLEIIFLIISGIFAFRTSWIILKIRVFHENMSIMLTCLWILWIEAFFAKIIILPFQFNLISLSGKSEIVSWWTSNYEKMLKIEEFSEIRWLFVASFILWHYIYSMFLTVFAMAMERIFATIYIEDYENTSRKHIPICLILLTHFFTIPLAFLITYNKLPFSISYGLIILFSISVLLINENYRALLMARRIVIGGTIYASIFGILFFFSEF
ncbi:unnamed protein product [Caenorhabditis angaria]|uniref:Uncharacterized protein n=1 Tax=Caenorhabditis angaria TaxID=860376 RepID=A0A9P1IDD6_9PELO|nr:unnamed protein product [Caenorhabditis angaria]